LLSATIFGAKKAEQPETSMGTYTKAPRKTGFL
jgi:hypothetical protein